MPKLIDAVLMTALCLFSASIGYELLGDLRSTTVAEYVPAVAMVACGHGLVEPAAPTPELTAFVRRERASLSCAEAGGGGSIASINVKSTRYAAYSLALACRIGGLSWSTLDRCLAAMAGLSVALAYVLFRLAVGPALAAAGAAALIFSNHTLAIALDFRDYGKDFWFIAAWLAIGWLLRRGQPQASRAIYGPAAAAGAVLGVGMGFRVDLAIIIPAVIAVIFLGLRGFSRPALVTKAIGTGVFAITFALVSAPILTTLSKESSLSHVIVLGLMTPFTDGLGLEPAPYDIGDLYADGFAAAAIYGHARQVDHDPLLGRLGTAAYDRQGISLLEDLAQRFPADAPVRALAAARQVIANPFDPDADREAATMAPLTRTPARRFASRVRAVLNGWLHGHELALIVAVFLTIAIRDRRLAVVAAALVLYFSGYSMLQFSRRHTFQLDIIPTGMVLVAVGGAASLVAGAARRRAGAAVAKTVFRAVIAGVAIVAAATSGLTLVRAWQQRHVTALFQRTLAAPSVDLPMTQEPLAGTEGPDGKPTGLLLRPAPGAWPSASAELFHAEYLVIELDGTPCAADTMRLVVRYSSIYHTTDSDYTRAFVVPLTGGTRVLVPIFELPGSSHFDGVSVAVNRLACVQRMRRVSPADRAPLPNVFAVLPAQWQSAPLYQRLRAAAVPPGRLPITHHDR